jgi:hypothetical protein
MNFIVWILKRIQFRLFDSDYGMIERYREIIKHEIVAAILLTFLLGIVQFIIGALMITGITVGRPPQWSLYVLLANPVVFFVYNWLVVLYRIYDSERQEVWEELKR